MNTNNVAASLGDVTARTLTGTPRIELGRILATPGALAYLANHRVDPLHLVQLHQQGKCGALDQEDVAANNRALIDGGRIFSSYIIGGDKVWVITEAVDDAGSRNSTTVLLPSEY